MRDGTTKWAPPPKFVLGEYKNSAMILDWHRGELEHAPRTDIYPHEWDVFRRVLTFYGVDGRVKRWI